MAKRATPFDIDAYLQYLSLEQKEIAAQKRKDVIAYAKESSTRIIVAFSGGKDSIAMVLHLLFVLHIPASRIELWHHEVDGMGEQLFDWKCTKTYCQAFARHFGLNLLFSFRKGGIVREIYRQKETLQDVFYQVHADSCYKRLKSQQKDKFFSTRLKFPAVSADLQTRWCSSVVKIQIMSRAIAAMADLQKANLLILTGERRAESTARSHYQEVENHITFSTTRKALVWRSIIDWTDKQVWDIMREHKIQPHPAYMLGWSRCSCQTCIFNSSNTWASLAELSPEKVSRIAQIEKQIGYTLYAKLTIHEKIAKGKSFLTRELIETWGKQATGEFTMPIITNNWQLPLGAKSLEQSGAS